ncbi:MAG: hypothetical protein RJA99_4256 [Pseudomonadota bacterium]
MPVTVITATLSAPIVLDDELHCDGLLASAHPLCRSSPISRSTPLDAIPMPALPIYRHEFGGALAYLGTAAQFADGARVATSHVVKRRDGEDIESLARPVHLGLGPGKNRLHALQTIVTPTVTWRTIGIRREVLHLVRRIQQLGMWRSAGYGIVATWHVDYVEEDGATVLVRDGVAQRHLPAAWCMWAESITAGPCLPPYWHPGRQSSRIVRAGTRCALQPTVEAVCRAVSSPDALRAHKARKDARALARRAGAYPPDVDARGPRAATHP